MLPFGSIARCTIRAGPLTGVKTRDTLFGEVALRFVTPITLFQFALPCGPSTRCGNVTDLVEVDAGSAFMTAHEGCAMKSFAITNAAKAFAVQPHFKRICVATTKSALGNR